MIGIASTPATAPWPEPNREWLRGRHAL